jgi:hypothetical protein
LFARDHLILEDFLTNTDSNLWHDLEPAMRLASHMLGNAPVMAFLRKVKFGREITDPDINRVYIVENSTGKSINQAHTEGMQDMLTLSQSSSSSLLQLVQAMPALTDSATPATIFRRNSSATECFYVQVRLDNFLLTTASTTI